LDFNNLRMANATSETVLQLELPGVQKTQVVARCAKSSTSGTACCSSAIPDAASRLRFDVIMPMAFPRKGEVLTQIRIFWFDARSESFQPNTFALRRE